MYIINRSRVVITFSLHIASLILLLGIFIHAAMAASVDIVEGDEWYYFKGIKVPPYKWNYIGFDTREKGWLKGRTGIGYDHQRTRTQLDDMRNNYRTVYARRNLNLSKAAYEFLQKDSVSITASIVCDGSFKVWLNGIEVIRSQNGQEDPGGEVQEASDIDITAFAQELLLPGKNVLAVECSNDTIDSSSFIFIPTLRVRTRSHGKS